MPKLEFTQEEIDNYVRGKFENVFYRDTIEIAREMAVHADGLVPEKLLWERRPNEPIEVIEYRKKIFEPKTKPVFSKIFSSLQKIRRSQDWSIRYEGEFPRIAEGETLEDYVGMNYPHFTSLTNWVFTLMLRKYLIDPNAVVFVNPLTREVPENEYFQPIASIYDSVNVIDYVEDDFAVLRNPTGAVYLSGKKYMKGERFYMITTQQVLTYDQVNGQKKFLLVDTFDHNLGMMPCFKLKGMLVEQVDSMYLYESKINGIIPELNEAIREYSDLQAAKVLHIYPERWEYTNSECTNCKGGGRTKNPLYTGPGCGCEFELVCDSCHGRGYTVAGPYSKIVVKPHQGTDAATGGQIPTPPAGYVEKDVEIVKIMEESINGHIYSALAAINFEFLAKTPLSESGIAKEVDKDELNNMVHSIAEDIVAAMDNIIEITAKLRYGTIYSEEEITKMLPVIQVPEKFDMLSAQHTQEELKLAKDGKANPIIISALEVDYTSKRFNTDPEIRDRLMLILSLDPLPNVSEDDKMSRLSNRGITQQTYVISSNIQEFVKKAIEEDNNFVDKDPKDQYAVMMKYADEVIASSEPKIEVPDTGLDQVNEDANQIQ